jgi:ABC-type glycerol-3-phosphate transport system substrate-binding protein
MSNMSTFKIVLISVFSVCIVIGLIVFAMQKSASSANHVTLTVWGTISTDAFNADYGASSIKANKEITVNYVQKNTSTFDTDFVQALADGVGPDMVILRDDLVYQERNRLFTVPYSSLSLNSFDSIFIQEAQTYLTPQGIVALPLMVDPMVMYWNRDLFSSNFVAQPPKYWDQFSDTSGTPGLISTITHRDTNANVTQSALALGEWDNVDNAKEILATLMLQAGTPISGRDQQGAEISALNSNPNNAPIQPSDAAVSFYTQFANPTSPTYTWNASLPDSLNFFLSGNLATYFGFASELFSIQQKNPNLNFDVTYMPQIRPAGTDTAKQSVFAHMYGISIVKQSRNIPTAFTAMTALVEPAAITALDGVTSLPPVRTDLLAAKPTNPYQVVFYNSALISAGWVDPNGTGSSQIFRTMIQSIDNGSARVSDALGTADQSLNLLFQN